MSEVAILIFRLRTARRRARAAAVAESIALLRDFQAAAPSGGPLSEEGGLFWVTLPIEALEAALPRLPRLGYTDAVDFLEASDDPPTAPGYLAVAYRRNVRWRGRDYRLARVYEEDPAAARDAAPDRRLFLLEDGTGTVRSIRGYRGDGGATSRRGLPVCDARLLVNLAAARPHAEFLEPFAGIGGIVLEAIAAGCQVTTTDLDPVLRHGLREMGARHCVADAGRLPFADASFDGVATEPPYHSEAETSVRNAFKEINRVLKNGGRLAMLCAARQAEVLRLDAAEVELQPLLDAPVDRKGLNVVALAWEKRIKG